MRAAVLAAALAAAAGAEAAPSLRIRARALKPGEALLVVVEGHDPEAPPRAELRGQSLDFFPAARPGTWLSVAGFDLEAATGPAVLKARLGAPGQPPVERALTLRLAPAAFAVRRLSVAARYVRPRPGERARAAAEAARLKAVFSRPGARRLFSGSFRAPLAGARPSGFGERRLFNGRPRAPHSGADLKAPAGTPVRAAASGRVALAGPLFFQGDTVLLDHGLGLTTLYAHLSEILVRPGQAVRRGQTIGRVGASGRATGPHLHWAAKWRSARLDPFSLAALDLDALLRPAPSGAKAIIAP